MTADQSPWLVIRANMDSNPKVAELPSDAVRWGWTCVLMAAKRQRPAGRFTSRQHFRKAVPEFARHIRAFLTQRLLEEAPDLCARCRRAWGEAPDGWLVVHDWHAHQRDPGAADRVAQWREDRAREAADVRETYDERTQDVRAANDVVTPDVRETYGIDTRGVTATSRAVAKTQTQTQTQTTRERESQAPKAVPARNGRGSPSGQVLLSRDQLDAWATFERAEWQPFKQAWLARGLRKTPAGSDGDDDTSQRGLLWQIAADWPEALGRWVSEAPGRTPREVIDHVLEQFHRMRAEAETTDGDEEWQATKRADAKGAMERLAVIQARVNGAAAEVDFGTAPPAAAATEATP